MFRIFGNHAINEQPMYSSILRRISDNLFRKKNSFSFDMAQFMFSIFHGWPSSWFSRLAVFVIKVYGRSSLSLKVN